MRKHTEPRLTASARSYRKVVPWFFALMVGVLFGGCGGADSQSASVIMQIRQDVTSSSPLMSQTSKSYVHRVDRGDSLDDSLEGSGVSKLYIPGSLRQMVEPGFDVGKSDSARSSLTSISSSWGSHPVEELMEELPPCGSFPTPLAMVISDRENAKTDFRVRNVDFNMVSEYGRVVAYHLRAWCLPSSMCPETPKSFFLLDCGESVEFVVDDHLIHAVHPGVGEHRALALGKNKVGIKIFDTRMYPELINRAAAEVGALSLLHGATSPTLFNTSIPPGCFTIVHSYHGYHHLGDLRGVASVPSMDLLTRLGIQGLKMLRFMHSKGIVHGSINLRTLRYRKRTNDDEIVDSLRLVDFWISSRPFVNSAQRLTSQANSAFQPVSYMSIFQLQSIESVVPAPSRRDDILGLAESLVMLVAGGEEIFDLDDADEILSRKRRLGFQATAYPRLHSLYKRARESDQDAAPNYDQMMAALLQSA
jgi:hypothetical protein